MTIAKRNYVPKFKTLEFTVTGATKGWDSDESVAVFRAALLEALEPLDLKSIRVAITIPKSHRRRVWTGQRLPTGKS